MILYLYVEILSIRCFFWRAPTFYLRLKVSSNPFDMNPDVPAHLGPLNLLLKHALPGAKEVLKLEDPGVVVGQVLLGVPHRGPEALEASVLLESNTRLNTNC